MIREANAAAQRMLNKARGMIRRGLLQLAGVSGSIQVEGHDGEVFTRVEHWGSWGVESRPPAGADVLLVLVGGDGSQPISIAMSHRAHRPTGLNEGDVALYASKSGSDQAVAFVRADGSIDLLPGGSEFVNVGTGAESMAMGDTLASSLAAFANAVAIATTVGQIATAGANLLLAIGTGGVNLKSTMGKVT